MAERKKHALYCDDESKTKQQFKDECNLCSTVKKYIKGSARLNVSVLSPVYADVSQIGSFQDCCNYVTNSLEAFSKLPSNIRDRFKNDPSELINFVDNPDNYDEAVKLGLVERKKDVSPVITPVTPLPVNQTPPAGGAQGTEVPA